MLFAILGMKLNLILFLCKNWDIFFAILIINLDDDYLLCNWIWPGAVRNELVELYHLLVIANCKITLSWFYLNVKLELMASFRLLFVITIAWKLNSNKKTWCYSKGVRKLFWYNSIVVMQLAGNLNIIWSPMLIFLHNIYGLVNKLIKAMGGGLTQMF